MSHIRRPAHTSKTVDRQRQLIHIAPIRVMGMFMDFEPWRVSTIRVNTCAAFSDIFIRRTEPEITKDDGGIVAIIITIARGQEQVTWLDISVRNPVPVWMSVYALELFGALVGGRGTAPCPEIAEREASVEEDFPQKPFVWEIQISV
jgi:hypothetical protein